MRRNTKSESAHFLARRHGPTILIAPARRPWISLQERRGPDVIRSIGPMLAASRFKQIAQVQELEPVLVPNASEAAYVSAAGRIWVRKSEVMLCANGMLAEALYWLMARDLKLPIPDAAIHCEKDNLGWLSARIDPVRHWDDGATHLITNFADLGGVIALDAVLGNGDRHDQNLLLEIHDDAHSKLWAIDHGNARVGWVEDFEALGVDPPRPHPNVRVSIDLVASAAATTAAQLAELPTEVLQSYVEEACLVAGTIEAVPRITAALAKRCGLANSIVTRYLCEIPRPA